MRAYLKAETVLPTVRVHGDLGRELQGCQMVNRGFHVGHVGRVGRHEGVNNAVYTVASEDGSVFYFLVLLPRVEGFLIRIQGDGPSLRARIGISIALEYLKRNALFSQALG